MTKISVIIPTYNDTKGILVTLNSLVNQDYDDKFEILVVDNNSTDNTYIVLENFINEFSDDNKYTIKLLQEEKIQSSYAARNNGIKHTNSELLCFIDSDMWVDKDFISKVVDAYQDLNPEQNKPFYMGCQVDIVMSNQNIFEKYDKISGFPMERYLSDDHFVGAGCLVINKKTIELIGNFDETLFSGGDREFGMRFFKKNKCQYFNKNIIIYHPARQSFRSHFVKKMRVGKGLTKFNNISYLSILIYFFPPRPLRFLNKCVKSDVSINVLDVLRLYILDYMFGHLAIILGYFSGMIYDK